MPIFKETGHKLDDLWTCIPVVTSVHDDIDASI